MITATLSTCWLLATIRQLRCFWPTRCCCLITHSSSLTVCAVDSVIGRHPSGVLLASTGCWCYGCRSAELSDDNDTSDWCRIDGVNCLTQHYERWSTSTPPSWSSVVQLDRRQPAGIYNGECRDMKRQTRKMERKYRRLRTTASETAWRQQFYAQRRFFQSKFTAFWLKSVNACRRDSRSRWRTVTSLLSPPLQCTSEELTADQFAKSSRTKVDSIRTATAPPIQQWSPLARCRL